MSRINHKNKTLKAGMLGGGINSSIGRVHQIAMQLDGRYQLVAGCFSRDEQTNQNSGRSFGVESQRIYRTDLEFFECESQNLDVVVIATPIKEHFRQIRLALERGLTVISDKPLVESESECQEICSLALSKGAPDIYCIFNYTGYPAVRELKRQVEEGRIGEIFKVMAEMPQDSYLRLKNQGKQSTIQQWRLKDGAIACVTLDLFVHLHSLVWFICGQRPISVNAWSRSISEISKNLIDEVDAHVRYDGGLVMSAWYGKVALGYRNGLRIRVFGTKGSLQWHQENPEHIQIVNNQGHTSLGDRLSPDDSVTSYPRYQRFKAGHPAGFIEAFANYYVDIADSIYTGTKSRYVVPLSAVSEGLKLAKAITESSLSRREATLD
jgi:predicted dehydrogenase